MCTSPLYALYSKDSDGNGKIHLLRNNFGFDDLNNIGLYDRLKSINDTGYIKIPCGQCLECRLEYSRIWANRLLCESKSYDINQIYFLTLTYDDDHIEDLKSDKNPYFHSLSKKHLQDFMKRLRSHLFAKHGFSGLRFFASGEYGDKSYRPHYHIILFGFDFFKVNDLLFYKNSNLGFAYYVSNMISKLWSYGFNVITPASWQTFNYVARYVIKKRKGKDSVFYDDAGIIPEFSTMSRRPGIGREYIEQHCNEIYLTDSLVLSDPIKGGIVDKPP